MTNVTTEMIEEAKTNLVFCDPQYFCEIPNEEIDEYVIQFLLGGGFAQ